jgi:hypothetical protein
LNQLGAREVDIGPQDLPAQTSDCLEDGIQISSFVQNKEHGSSGPNQGHHFPNKLFADPRLAWVAARAVKNELDGLACRGGVFSARLAKNRASMP